MTLQEKIALLKNASVHIRMSVFDKKTNEKVGIVWCMVGQTFINEYGWELNNKSYRSNHGIKDLIVGMRKMKKAIPQKKYVFGEKYIIDTYGKPKGLTKSKAEKIVKECWEQILA